MPIEKPVRTLGETAGGGGTVTVAGITDATTLGKDILLTVDVPALLALISALGSSGDQVLDGKLQLNHQLVLKSIEQTDANVLAFYFGEDDGVLDVSIKATATVDNHGQLALGVRDDTGNVINALTIDGNSKAIMIWPGYKFHVGNSNVDISGVTPFGKTVLECQDAAALRTLIGVSVNGVHYPATLLTKLLPENNVNLGSDTVFGAAVNTSADQQDMLTVVNTFLKDPVTTDELALILKNKEDFVFSIGVGDRRNDAGLYSRFGIVDNWSGDDVLNRVLTPEPYPSKPYNLTMSLAVATDGSGKLLITDTHSGANQFGAIRYFTIRKRGES